MHWWKVMYLAIMSKTKPKITTANLEEKFSKNLKKLSSQDLRDILAILYSEPELAIYNTDFDQLTKEEKERYQSERAKMTYFDQQRLNALRDKLVNEFHVFESIQIPDPAVLGTSPSYPKASLLTALIKSILNLRETGKELPDELTIKQIELFISDHSENDYQIVINGDYSHPLKVSRSIKIWNMFFDLVNNGYLDRNEETQDLYDYLNYNPNNKIITNAKYPRQRMINLESSSFRPNFKSSVQTEKALVQRQNKSKSST